MGSRADSIERQYRVDEALKPAHAPHEAATENGHDKLASTGRESAPEAAE